MLRHDECYIVTHLKKKHSAVKIFDPEDEGVTCFRNVSNTLPVSTTQQHKRHSSENLKPFKIWI